jgi:uncharacterized protein
VSQPLAIVGASARSATASAVRAGFQAITADLFADADLRAIATSTRISPYPEGLVDWFRVVEPMAWMYTGALENHPELVDQLAWIAPLWGNPGDVLMRVRSPWELAEALAAAGLLFPETRSSSEGLPHDASWLMKSCCGASGSGVREWGVKQAAESSEQESSLPIIGPAQPVCFQRRINGMPCSAVFVAMDDTSKLVGVTRQLVGESWLGAHGFQYAGSIGPLPIPQATRETIARIGEVLTKQFELRGIFGVDFILDAERVWTLEVNPRYTASVEIVERATGLSAVAMHATACAEGLENRDFGVLRETSPQPPAPSPLYYGKAIMFAKRDIVISTEFAEIALTASLQRPWPTLADVSPAGTPIDAGRPIITVFTEGETVDDVERHLRIRVEELERQLYGNEVPS